MIKVYYALFDTNSNILKNDNSYKLFDIAKEKEIDIASAKRKSYKKELKNKVKYKSL